VKKMMRFIPLLCFILSAGCSTFQTEYEDLVWDFELGWKVGHHTEVPNQSYLTEFIREGDDINNWRELVTIVNHKVLGDFSPENVFLGIKLKIEKDCPNVTEWNVIEKNKNSMLYEWQTNPCLGFPAQHEIARIISGKYNVFQIKYTARGYQLPPDQRAKWLKIIAGSKIETSRR
jgi:hypothetical protein